MMPVDYFRTDRRWNEPAKSQRRREKRLPLTASDGFSARHTHIRILTTRETKIRTVFGLAVGAGCV